MIFRSSLFITCTAIDFSPSGGRMRDGGSSLFFRFYLLVEQFCTARNIPTLFFFFLSQPDGRTLGLIDFSRFLRRRSLVTRVVRARYFFPRPRCLFIRKRTTYDLNETCTAPSPGPMNTTDRICSFDVSFPPPRFSAPCHRRGRPAFVPSAQKSAANAMMRAPSPPHAVQDR